ncbi:hypothetical protein BOX15_Mlig000017g2 [Macrostomum lignano]|nr:hypothetical protein BOX15_Mlig000017g2 [Macrostomum lignano]
MGVSEKDLLAYVRVSDGSYASKVLAFIGGAAPNSTKNITSTDLVSSGNLLQLEFRARAHSNTLGFRLRFDTTRCFCQRYQVLHCNSGEIFSHSEVGVRPYLDNMLCEWLLVAKTRGYKLCAQISYASLQSANDTVTLLHGNNGTLITAVKGGTASAGHHRPTIFCATSGTMAVIFSTDGSGRALGFRLRYEAFAQWDSPSLDRFTTREYSADPITTSSLAVRSTIASETESTRVNEFPNGSASTSWSTTIANTTPKNISVSPLAKQSVDANESSALKISLSTLSAIFLVVSAAIVAVVIYKRKFGLNIRRNPFISRFTSGSRRLDEEGIVKYSGTNSVELPNEAEHDS